MRDQVIKVAILDKLRIAMIQSPDMRVCQIISNAMNFAGHQGEDHFSVEDSKLLEALGDWITERNRSIFKSKAKNNNVL